MIKAVIYIRVSSQEQTQGYSLENQEESCLKYAEQNGMEVLKIFREEGVSAKTVSGRPELLELLKYCRDKKNKVSTVVVHRYDRWSRDTLNGLDAIAILAKEGVNLVSVTEPAQEGAFGKAIRNIMLVVAQLDNDLKSERTKSGMMAAFKAGRWPWKPKIGYKNIIVGEKKKVILIPEFKPILTNLFVEAASGLYTKAELAEKLNKAGYKKLWGSSANEKTIDTIIKSKFYFGVMESLTWKMEQKGIHSTVTDEDTWLLANKALYGNSPTFSKVRHDMPLRRFVLCGNCNNPLTGSFSQGRGKKYGYYHCTRKECSEHVRVAIKTLEEQFVEYLNQFSLTSIQQKLLEAVLIKNAEGKMRQQERTVERINQALEALKEEKRDILRSKLLSQAEKGELIEDVRTRETVLKMERAEDKIDYKENEAVIDFVKHFTKNVGNYWERLDLPRQVALQSKIFPEKVAYDGENFRTTHLSQSFELIKAYSEAKFELVTPPGVEPGFLG